MDGNKKTTNLDQRPSLKVFVDFLKNNCKIVSPVYSSEASELKIMFRNFNGNERLRIFEELFKKYLGPLEKGNNIFKRKNFNDLYPSDLNENFNFTFENEVWLEFHLILKMIKQFKTKPFDPEILRPKLTLWLRAFLKISQINRNFKTIGPYLHIWSFHLIELLQIHKNLNIFNTQGLEKLNGFCIQYYHTSTNKQVGRDETKNKYLKQLISKRNRLEFSILSGEFNDFFEEDSTDEEDYNPEYESGTSSSGSEYEENISEDELFTSSEEEL
jgi:hypothetical protein